MKHYYSADPDCLKPIWVIIAVAYIVIIALSAAFLSSIKIIMIPLIIICTLLGLFFTFIYLPRYIRNLKYCITDGKIIKESGFYFHKKQIIRLDKVQFTSSVYSPWKILRSLNLIILYAYGGFMVIIFLNNDKFAELKTFL